MRDQKHSAHQDLTDHSNRILQAVEELHQMENEKREETISTPPFHELADEIREKSREIFRIASEQQDLGEQADQTGDSINDVAESEERDPRPAR
jgi:hypothetical protein